jgi:hypothetical protein
MNFNCEDSTTDMSLEFPSFHNLESFSFPAPPQVHPSLPATVSSFATQRDHEESLVAGVPQVASARLKFETLSLIESPCLFCKGKKYGFTAYFHNHKIFPEPPHEILPLVEESYVLRDRLKSLLVTYAIRDVEQDEAENVMVQIHHWDFSVGALTDEVMNSASNSGFVLNLGRLDDVRKWKDAIVGEFKYYVSAPAQMKQTKLPSGRLSALMLEYRKVWEAVWMGYMHDHKMMQSELDSTGYHVCM